MDSRLVKWLDAAFYPGSDGGWAVRLFRDEILKFVGPDRRMLDVGAGAGICPEMSFRGLAKSVAGIDPDPRVTANPYLDEAQIGLADAVPYADETFDLAVCDNVLEHLGDPAKVFSEIARTLKPGGWFLVKTPNKWHYMPVIARCTPHWFHVWVTNKLGRKADDTFPTFYRANSPGTISAFAKNAGLEVRHMTLIEGRPEYTRIYGPLYILGCVYERIVNRVPGLSRLRILIIAVMQKPNRNADVGNIRTAA